MHPSLESIGAIGAIPIFIGIFLAILSCLVLLVCYFWGFSVHNSLLVHREGGKLKSDVDDQGVRNFPQTTAVQDADNLDKYFLWIFLIVNLLSDLGIGVNILMRKRGGVGPENIVLLLPSIVLFVAGVMMMSVTATPWNEHTAQINTFWNFILVCAFVRLVYMGLFIWRLLKRRYNKTAAQNGAAA